ncbi:caspase family protein [Ekhidna sp. MALMAid0563]|uniref:caspase family protein n=1 Tax=Ekhidna sp. MALMAid0563 TaxID=3143937 RepID=UPI0032E0001A
MKNMLTLLFILSFTISLSQQGELVIRQGHTAGINMVQYSPTGKYVYSASNDKSIKMWDVQTGIDVNTFNAHEAPVNSIHLSDDGKLLVSADQAGSVILWDAITGEVKTKINAHIGSANTAKLSKDASQIISGGDDEVLKIWNASGDSIKTITGFSAPIMNLAISPNGDRIVTGGGKNNGVEVKLVDPAKGKILADALDNVKGSGAAIAYTKAIMTGFAVIGNVANGRVGKDMTTIFVMTYSNIQFTKDGNRILFSQNIFTPFIAEKGEEEETGNASVSIIELSDDRQSFGEVSKPIRWQLNNPRGVAILSQDETKVIVNEQRSIKVYDIENAEFPEPGKKETTQYVPPVVKEIKNITKHTNWLALSPDYRTVVTSDQKRQLKLYDYETGRKIRDMEGYVQPALAVDIMPDGKHILVGSLDRDMAMWDITTGALIKTFDRSSDVSHIDVSSDGKYMATTAVNTSFMKIWNFRTGRIYKTLKEKKDNIVWVKFNPNDEDKIWALTDNDDLNEWSIRDFKSKRYKANYRSLEDKFKRSDYFISFDGYDVSIKKGTSEIISDTQQGVITDAVFSIDSKFAITTNETGEISLYDLNKGEKSLSMALIGENGFIAYTPDFYYTSSKNAARAIAFKEGNEVLPFEQLELKYNRPDIVAKTLGYAPEKLIASYEAAYKKRLNRLGFSEDDLSATNELPMVDIDIFSIPLETDERMLTFTANADGKGQVIDRLQVYVNDVPAFGSKGLSVDEATQLSSDITIELSKGLNEIKVTAINKKGLESLPQSFEVQLTTDFDKPDLYLVSIGVSQYQQSQHNLAFAAKDASDMIATMKGSSAYENVFEKLITNERATDTNIKAIRSFIEQAGVDDVVMIFIAGHGVLDDSYTYYFATHNMDFNNPSNGGLNYEELQALIDGIKCRNKLLMMDTCHSGELDEDDIEEAEESISSVGTVAFRSTGSLVKLKENSFGLENTLELSKALFGDMRKGTGATVISAAGGTEFAAEGVNSDNGLFTSCLIQGFRTRRADLNRNRDYTVSEIRQYVGEQVILLSNGKQVPTSREENIKNDFRIY